VHATAVTASQTRPAGQLSVRTMASCYNGCVHSRLGPGSGLLQNDARWSVVMNIYAQVTGRAYHRHIESK